MLNYTCRSGTFKYWNFDLQLLVQLAGANIKLYLRVNHISYELHEKLFWMSHGTSSITPEAGVLLWTVSEVSLGTVCYYER